MSITARSERITQPKRRTPTLIGLVAAGAALAMPLVSGCGRIQESTTQARPSAAAARSHEALPSPSPTVDLCNKIGFCSLGPNVTNNLVEGAVGVYQPAKYTDTMPIVHGGKQVGVLSDQDHFLIHCSDKTSVTMTVGKVTGQIGLTPAELLSLPAWVDPC